MRQSSLSTKESWCNLWVAGGRNSAPCRVSVRATEGSYILRLFFCAGVKRQRIGLRVVHTVGLDASVIPVNHQFCLGPDQFEKPVFGTFVESLDRPKEIIDGLQTGNLVRVAG